MPVPRVLDPQVRPAGPKMIHKTCRFLHEILSRADTPTVCYHGVHNNYTWQQIIVPGVKYFANPVSDEAVRTIIWVSIHKTQTCCRCCMLPALLYVVFYHF